MITGPPSLVRSQSSNLAPVVSTATPVWHSWCPLEHCGFFVFRGRRLIQFSEHFSDGLRNHQLENNTSGIRLEILEYSRWGWLPSLKRTASFHLKIDGWKTFSLLGFGRFFSGANLLLVLGRAIFPIKDRPFDIMANVLMHPKPGVLAVYHAHPRVPLEKSQHPPGSKVDDGG